MKTLDRRLIALEGQRKRPMFDHLTEDELEERVADLTSRIIAGLEERGISLPANWDEMRSQDRDVWFAARIKETEV